jgi:hypothetical protein
VKGPAATAIVTFEYAERANDVGKRE